MQQAQVSDDVCPVWGDPIVAYHRKKDKLVGNLYIYHEEDTSNQDYRSSDIEFTSVIAQELKKVFDSKFDTYKSQLSRMNEIAPKAISQSLD